MFGIKKILITFYGFLQTMLLFLNPLVSQRSGCGFLSVIEARRASHLTQMRPIACVPGRSSISPPGRH